MCVEDHAGSGVIVEWAAYYSTLWVWQYIQPNGHCDFDDVSLV